MRISFSLILCFIFFTKSFAQHHVCGTTITDQQNMEEMFARHGQQEVIFERGDVIYIPVKFHLVGNNEGKGKVSYKSILNQLDILNRDYAAHNFKFYLKDGYNFGSIDNTTLYTDPRNNENQLKPKKDPKAINVFVVSTIGSSNLGGTVLGYYSPSNDFVVVIKGELDNKSTTLSHEIGHFFNLRHTFYGWEDEPYTEATHGNPCLLNFAPGTNIQVEKVNGTNCTVAGDNVCDTPPDYHFDINYGGTSCSFSKIVKDKNGDTIKTMLNNQMSYFFNCQKYEFTTGQENRMRTNYNNSARSHLRSTYVPNSDTLPSLTNFIFPQDKDTAYNYSSVDITWENVNADYYLLEIQSSTEFYSYFTTNTFYNVTDLKAKKTYFATVRAFNDGYTGTSTFPTRFFTGDLQTGTDETAGNSDFVKVYPNPSSDHTLYIQSASPVNRIELINTNGTSIDLKVEKISAETYTVNTQHKMAANSLGLLKIHSDKAVVIKKIIKK